METNQPAQPKFTGFGPRIGRIFGWAGIGLVFACLFALFFGLIVKWLWNMLMPAIFGLGAITFWQAFALIILAKLLFGGFGHPHHSPHRSWHNFGGHCGDGHPRFWNHGGSPRSDSNEKMRDWKMYRNFWQDEGKEAFKAYVAKHNTAAKNEGIRENNDQPADQDA